VIGRKWRETASKVVWIGCIALIGVLLIGLLSWSMVLLQRGTVHRDHQIDALVTEVHDISDSAAADRRTATRERRELQRKLDASLAAQEALLAYLRGHGIHVPTKFFTIVQRQTVVRHHHARHHVKRRSSTTNRSGTSTTPTGPGKSGTAPGHRKHRHRH
jgi:hypothetical protein